ncbi:PREDICTED: ubiquitin carboxyl-terminal hydrolase 15-like, partial [Amphimedon queenslandica]|uniref:DUSP domain-containing protein n=2 Tax=Amphimedon queenslandica TaxID=400682 RepID=A0AAN0IU28_AMPQE
MKQRLVKDDIWCLVSCHWFEKWTKFIDIALKAGTDGCNKSSHPGPVTNFTLIKFINFQAPKLKKDLAENLDYKLIPEIGWDLLIQWYGISEKSMRLSRKVIKVQKHAIGKLMIEVYPVTVLVQLVFPESPD